MLFENRTAHQHLAIFHNAAFGRVLVLDGIVQTTGQRFDVVMLDSEAIAAFSAPQHLSSPFPKAVAQCRSAVSAIFPNQAE